MAIVESPETRHWQSFLPIPDEQACRQWVNDAIYHNELESRQGYNQAILLESSQEAVGWIGWGAPSAPEKGAVDFGYAIVGTARRQNVATEALQAVIDFNLGKRGVDSIFGECAEENVASARVMQKAGLDLSAAWLDEDGQAMQRYFLDRATWLSR